MDLKSIPMTDEYAAKYFHQMGWQSARLTESFNPMAMREKIAQEIEAARQVYLELAKDKNSEDYQFYNGYCNALHFAIMLARGKNAH
jgi:hypothetical protein